MTKVGLVIDDRYLRHDPGIRHPESPRRLAAVGAAIAAHVRRCRWACIEPRVALPEELELVHRPSLIHEVETACRRAPAHLDPDTAVSADSYETALLAVGGVLQCVDEIMSGKIQRAFACVRPPGHHAGPRTSMGFCLFNNVAVAAAYARAHWSLERIAVVDIDLHHGNGTQQCFYDDPGIFYCSSHQYPFYPGTGDFEEIGAGEGKGYTLNIPLPAGTGDAALVPVYTRIAGAALQQYHPQLVVVSAGFDAHYLDPLGGLALTTAGYASIAASLTRAANASCGGRILFVLEGGYSTQALQECTDAVMTILESDSPEEWPLEGDDLYRDLSDRLRRSAGSRWKW